MEKCYLDAQTFVKMIYGGAQNLNLNKKTVNDLNVFPVPDGDTGDNMYMTINSFRGHLSENDKICDVANDAAKSMLLGARGNSGVILSRIFAGIAKGLEGVDKADLNDVHKMMISAVNESYNAVSNPVEGTILSVFKDGVLTANNEEDISLKDYFDLFIKAIEESLDKTPELLKVLKDAGVVDSGGAGLVYIANGMRDALNGKVFEAVTSNNVAQRSVDLNAFKEDSILEYGYCTEFLLRLQSNKVDLDNFDEKVLFNYLKENGESVVCFKEGTIIKVHIHTFRPGEILNHCQEYGEFLTLKIENMMIQHNEVTTNNSYQPKKIKKKNALVAVASGDGVEALFKDNGVDVIVSGGQSMNPSTNDFIEAFKTINAENIIVLPNNKNIFLAVEQAKELYKDANIYMLKTRNVGEGYIALANLDLSDPNVDLDEAIALATSSTETMVTAMIAKASRDVKEDDVTKGHYIGFIDDDIKVCKEERLDAIKSLLNKLDAGSRDAVLVIYGQDVDEEEINQLVSDFSNENKITEMIPINGGQPIYDYIIVLE